jgi:hypothetical protein
MPGDLLGPGEVVGHPGVRLVSSKFVSWGTPQSIPEIAEYQVVTFGPRPHIRRRLLFVLPGHSIQTREKESPSSTKRSERALTQMDIRSRRQRHTIDVRHSCRLSRSDDVAWPAHLENDDVEYKSE